MAPQQKRPPSEYIEKLSTLHKVWNRENEEANKLVFADLDIMLNKYMEDAYGKEHYEAYAYCEKLREYIRTGFAAKLKGELDYVKKLPE
jgi:hypothetical protein